MRCRQKRVNVILRMLSTAVVMWGLSIAISCGPVHYVRISDPVGPSSEIPFTPRVEKGGLVVHTDKEEFVRGGDYYYPHSSYTIHAVDGELIRRVENHRGIEDYSPDRVIMNAGTYLIRAHGLGRRIEVIVQVEPGQTTAVYLDGSWSPPAGAPADALVRTPDGVFIGWRTSAIEE